MSFQDLPLTMEESQVKVNEADSRTEEGLVESQAGIDEMEERGIRYMPPHLDRVEDIEAYQEGGYHPVLIGDQLKEGKYTIIHKLGQGGFATAWLARDTEEERYVAIKIVMAEASEDAMRGDIIVCEHIKDKAAEHSGSRYLDIPIDNFWITGPNGSHLCIVSDIAGPSIAQLSHARLLDDEVATLGPRDAQIMSLQIAQALEFLHSPGVSIAHGDLTSANVLLELENLDSIPQEELIKVLGQPVQEQLQPYGEHKLDGSAPEFIYGAIDAMRLLPYCTGNVKIIDFGASYFLNSPPVGLATPLSACSPEYLRDGKFGKESDVWAFAVTLFEMRAGHPLITSVWGGEDEVLGQIQTILGTFPPRLEDETMTTQLDRPLLRTLITDIRNQGPINRGNKKHAKKSWVRSAIDRMQKGARKYRKWLARLKLARDEKDRTKISSVEAESFHDLLSKLFSYDVERRLAMEQVWKHTWFTTRL